MCKRKTHEEFIKEVFDEIGNAYEFIEEYTNKKTKLKVKHNKCGKISEMLPRNIIKGSCKYCSNQDKLKTSISFSKEVYNLVGDDYSILRNYINSKTKVAMKHNYCGHEYDVLPSNFIKGTRCPNCFGNKKKDTEEFKKEVFKLVSNEYIVLGEYSNNKTKIKMKHNECGHYYYVAPDNFLSGNRCPECANNKKKTTKKFKEEVCRLVGKEYEVLGEYIHAHEYVEMRHVNCKSTFHISPANFLSGNRCPKCKIYKGEFDVEKYLKSSDVQYIKQEKFDGCRNIRLLPFDFYLKDILIEYDGEQHFKVVDFFGGDKHYKYRISNDKIKIL